MINKDIRVKSALKIVLSVLYAAKELFVSNKRVVILLTLVISVVESVVTDDFDSDQLTASCDNLTYSFHNDFETYG